MSSPSLTLTFDEQRPAQLVGTHWVTNGRITGPVTGFSGLQSELRLNGDRTWTFARCTTSVGGRYAVNGTQLTFTFDSPAPATGCVIAAQADEVAALITLLQSPVTFTITEQTLRLMGTDGNGELFIAVG